MIAFHHVLGFFHYPRSVLDIASFLLPGNEGVTLHVWASVAFPVHGVTSILLSRGLLAALLSRCPKEQKHLESLLLFHTLCLLPGEHLFVFPDRAQMSPSRRDLS